MKLYHGDCLEMMKDIPDKSIDLILTDPPYGTTQCKWDSVIPFDKMWEQLERVIKDNGAIVLFGSEPFSSALRMSNIKDYRYDWYWNKKKGNGFQYSHKQPLRQIETISVFYKTSCKYDYKGEKLQVPVIHTYPIVKSDSCFVRNKNLNKDGSRIYKTYEYKTKTNLLDFSRDSNKLHPTQKPVPLLEYLIKTYTNENEIVLDFTMGSGSTGVACVNTNRDFIGIELEKKYFEIAKKRIEEAEKEKEGSLF